MGLAAAAIPAHTPGGGDGDLGSYLLGVGILLVVVVVSTVVLLWVRRKMLDSSAQGFAGFSTMEELRTMVARGEMTKEEYEMVRKTMIDKVRQQTTAGEGDPSHKPGRGGT